MSPCHDLCKEVEIRVYCLTVKQGILLDNVPFDTQRYSAVGIPTSFKLLAHLGGASYIVYAHVKHTSSLFSAYGIQLLFSVPAENCDL